MALRNYGDLGAQIFNEIIAPDFEFEVRDVVRSRFRWRKISDWVEGIAHVLLGATSILAFSAGFFGNIYLAYAAACCSTVCLAMMRFSAYANGESIERNTILNRMLAMAGIDPMPTPTEPPTELQAGPAVATATAATTAVASTAATDSTHI